MTKEEYYKIKAFMDGHKDIDNMIEVSSVVSFIQKMMDNTQKEN